jgi:C-terminal processing protease CtpA/Prc
VNGAGGYLVPTPGARRSTMYGYLRILTFNHWPPEEFVSEFMRLISALPQGGLIIDIRGNGGGVIMNNATSRPGTICSTGMRISSTSPLPYSPPFLCVP